MVKYAGMALLAFSLAGSVAQAAEEPVVSPYKDDLECAKQVASQVAEYSLNVLSETESYANWKFNVDTLRSSGMSDPDIEKQLVLSWQRQGLLDNYNALSGYLKTVDEQVAKLEERSSGANIAFDAYQNRTRGLLINTEYAYRSVGALIKAANIDTSVLKDPGTGSNLAFDMRDYEAKLVMGIDNQSCPF